MLRKGIFNLFRRRHLDLVASYERLDKQLQQFRHGVAMSIMAEKNILNQFERNQERVSRWEQRVEEARRDSKFDLADMALQRQLQHASASPELERELSSIKEKNGRLVLLVKEFDNVLLRLGILKELFVTMEAAEQETLEYGFLVKDFLQELKKAVLFQDSTSPVEPLGDANLQRRLADIERRTFEVWHRWITTANKPDVQILKRLLSHLEEVKPKQSDIDQLGAKRDGWISRAAMAKEQGREDLEHQARNIVTRYADQFELASHIVQLIDRVCQSIESLTGTKGGLLCCVCKTDLFRDDGYAEGSLQRGKHLYCANCRPIEPPPRKS